jgi:hypothetical protein
LFCQDAKVIKFIGVALSMPRRVSYDNIRPGGLIEGAAVEGVVLGSVEGPGGTEFIYFSKACRGLPNMFLKFDREIFGGEFGSLYTGEDMGEESPGKRTELLREAKRELEGGKFLCGRGLEKDAFDYKNMIENINTLLAQETGAPKA